MTPEEFNKLFKVTNVDFHDRRLLEKLKNDISIIN
jgi:hypothetical protein